MVSLYLCLKFRSSFCWVEAYKELLIGIVAGTRVVAGRKGVITVFDSWDCISLRPGHTTEKLSKASVALDLLPCLPFFSLCEPPLTVFGFMPSFVLLSC